MAQGLWESALRDWYGPATPLVRRVRSYRPDRRGRIKLARWLRVGLLRALVCASVGVVVLLAVDPAHMRLQDRAAACAVVLAQASFWWRGSMIRVVLRPGEIVRYGVWRHVVVPCSAVKEFGQADSPRGGLVLRTVTGEVVDFGWFESSLWNSLYDFSRVCVDAMRAHARTASGSGPAPDGTALRRHFTWSAGADPLAAAAVVCLGLALFGVVRG